MEDNSYSQLIEESIRLHFERNGTLDEMRSGLHVKVLKMLHTQKKLRKDEPLCGGDLVQRGLLHLLNQLIVDYFDWFGYKHTLETFALETGDKSRKSRAKLQKELIGDFEQKELPILLQMLMKQAKRDDDEEEDVDKDVKDNKKALPEPPAPKKEIQAEDKLPVQAAKHHNQLPKLRAPANIIKNFSAKVNVRQSMVEEDAQTKANRKWNKKPIRITEKKMIGSPKKSSNSETSSESPESSTEPDSDEYNSDAFAEIPNRYYYREQEPPEKTYPPGFGEEGPYEGPKQQQQQQQKTKDKQLNTRPIGKPKPLRIFELDNKGKQKPQSTTKMTSKAKPKASAKKPSKFLYQSHRRLQQTDDELEKINYRKRCPETMVSSIRMDDTADDSDEDSDTYL